MARIKPITKDTTGKAVTRNAYQLIMGVEHRGVTYHPRKVSPRNFRQQGATLNGRQYGQ